MKGDRALRQGDTDKLGFREIAEQLATSLVDHASNDGLVVGIEGPWGCGKSSLVYLIEEELGVLPEEKRPTIIKFRPWLVSNRDALLAHLFNSLTQEIDQVALKAGDASRTSISKAKAAGEALRKFAAGVSKAGSVVEFAGDATSFLPLKWIGQGLTALRSLVSDAPPSPSLDLLKAKLVASLRELGHRFIVTIDDVDRLEPVEVIEVLRLTRSVADFPNVIYLLCYDSEILAHSIEEAAKVPNGRSYLEKIVQLTIMVPQPEPFQLRQWLSDELGKLTSTTSESQLARLKSVIDCEGQRQLRTPRSVVRVLDAILFYWPPLREAGADFADLLWLQLVKDGNAPLYRWIEDYCAKAATYSLGTINVDEADREKALKDLRALVPPDYFDNVTYRRHFSDQLPGIDTSFSKNGWALALYEQVDRATRNQSIRDGRLSSPDHYRLYFSFSGPTHALTRDDLGAASAATETSSEQAEKFILDLQSQIASGSLSRADVLLERLEGGNHALLTHHQIRNLLLALSNAMDDAYRLQPFDTVWINSTWDRAERITATLLKRLDTQERASVVDIMFRDGRAIGWLTKLFRSETFAHGRYGERKRPDDEWILDDDELDRARDFLLARYNLMSVDEFFQLPDPLDLLFAWKQSGDQEGPKRLIGQAIVSDEGLVRALESLVTVVTSSNRGRYNVLTRDNIEPFMNYAEVRSRIVSLSSKILDEELSKRVARLVAAFEDGGRR